MSTLAYHSDMARLLREAQTGDETAEKLALRLSLRRGDREVFLPIVRSQIDRAGIARATFIIDGEEPQIGLSIPDTLTPVRYESPGGQFVHLCWDERIGRLFAADVAEHVLHIYEREYPGDLRPRKAIGVAIRFARGEATQSELNTAYAAARAAAAAAAWLTTRAAWAAAAAAAWAAHDAAVHAALAASDAAWAAARDAATAFAREAGGAGGWAAYQEEVQLPLLLEYLLGEVVPCRQE